MEIEKLVGLRPYQKEEADIFYGREKEVEGLLQILQKDKLVTLIGAPGTGKSSLINAGLIPRLEKGFLAQAGKQWAVCKFRPGISPMENLAYSLTSEGSLTLDGKANTEDFSEYMHTLKDLASLGMVEIFNKSQINGKKNLLIVIDQLEDLFTFERFFDSDQSEQDDLLFDMVARTVKIKDTAIYFALVIQSDYLSHLSQYAKLQEMISKSQYAIPNFSKAGITAIVENNFLEQGLSFSNSAFKSIVDDLASDATLLPNMQFLFRQIIAHKNEDTDSEASQVATPEIDALGGINHCIQQAFETSYKSLSDTQKIHFEKINKALYNFENANDGKYEQIERISVIAGLSTQEISDVIFQLKAVVDESFEIIPRAITGVPKNDIYSLNHDDLLSNKYFLQRNWKQENQWIYEEEESYKSFKNFSELTENFNSGKASLLFTPELEMAQEWVENDNHNTNWAKKYSFNFQNTVDYIYKSIDFHQQNRSREENRLIRKKKTTRIVGAVMSVLIIIAFALFIRSSYAETRALASKEKADASAREAILERKEASKQKEKADSLRNEAEIAQKNAENDKIIALDAKKSAELATERALDANTEAKQQTEIAQKQKLMADKAREQAESEKKNADKAREESENRRKIAEIESEFYPIVRKMERLVEYANASDEIYQNKVFSAIDEALRKFEEHFQIQNEIYGTAEDTEGNYMILQTALRVLEGKNYYNETSMMLYRMSPNTAIRSIDSFNDSVLAFGGDNGVLYILNSLDLSMVEIPIKERIRKVKFIDPNKIVVGTFQGNVYKVNPSKRFVKNAETKLFNSKNPIVDLHMNSNGNELIIFSNHEVIFYNEKNKTSDGKKVSFEIKGIDFYNDQLFIASSNEIFMYNGKNIIKLPLDIDHLVDEEIQTFRLSKEFLFVGTQTGKILTYINSNPMNGQIPLKFLGELELHRSGITKLYFDEQNSTLYSASFDNQILKYKVEKLNFERAVREFISLIGHEKWIWDLGLTKNEDGKELIVTVDENGNVLTWYKNLADLAAKVKNLLSEKTEQQ
jgi:hypothetical protein